jgi:hypothetical protein
MLKHTCEMHGLYVPIYLLLAKSGEKWGTQRPILFVQQKFTSAAKANKIGTVEARLKVVPFPFVLSPTA